MAFYLPIVSVILGFLIAFFSQKGTKSTQLLLSYSGALLLSVTVFEFLPHVYQDFTPVIGLLIMAGVLLQVILEFMSKGAEHGHLHHDQGTKAFPGLLFVSLCIHSFMEGVPITQNIHLLLGVVIHKIPVAIIISAFLLNSKISKKSALLFLALFALMTPAGALFSETLSASPQTEQYINALVIGIFLHVSTTILFESSRNHQFNWSKIILIILGVFTAYFI